MIYHEWYEKWTSTFTFRKQTLCWCQSMFAPIVKSKTFLLDMLVHQHLVMYAYSIIGAFGVTSLT